jgi:hypothetical protein
MICNEHAAPVINVTELYSLPLFLVCSENELPYRGTLCFGWTHAACSSYNSAKNFICDYRR